MILTGEQIKWAQQHGYLNIDPWDDKRLNPNSYNLRLADELMVYGETIPGWEDDPIQLLDMKAEMPTTTIKIPEKGYVIKPGVLYLGRTIERTETHKFVPMLEGRSSGGRLGISIHETAGFGDIGFCGYWTLEITCAQAIRIYAGVDICQIYYHMVCDNDDLMRMCLNTSVRLKYDNGKYQNNKGIQPSMLWKEFNEVKS